VDVWKRTRMQGLLSSCWVRWRAGALRAISSDFHIVMQSVTHTVNCNWYWPAAAEGSELDTSTQRSSLHTHTHTLVHPGSHPYIFRPQFRFPNPICFPLCVVFLFAAVVVVAIAVAVAPAFSHFMHSIFHKHTCTGQQKHETMRQV